MANKINAAGVIFGQTKTVEMRRGSAAQASIMVKLVDPKGKSIVATSYHESSSIFGDSESLVKEVSSESIEDFKMVFDRLVGLEPEFNP